MIQPMSISDQIIAVINDLCMKFGVVIDWTAENVMPYIEDLCGRYIQYEVQTSIVWGIIMLGATLIAGITWGASAFACAVSLSEASDVLRYISMVIFWILLALSIVVCAVQAFDIIACNTITEKVIVEYIEILINNSSSR